MATILHEDVDDYADFDKNDATNEFLTRWTDAGQLSEDDKGTKPTKAPTKTSDAAHTDVDEDEDENDQSDEGDADESSADEDDTNDDETDADSTEGAETKLASDDYKVKLTVDGTERTVSVKDLKRLYGQEASLTRKSQEVADLRKQAEETSSKTTTALNVLVKRAEERWKPYSEVDYLVAQTQLSAEDFATLRAEAKAAYDDHVFLTQELNNHGQQVQAQQIVVNHEVAKAAIETLTRDIPNWNQKLYDDIRIFSVKAGLNEQAVNSIVDPTIIKLLHNAMLYERGKSVATTKKVAAAKKVLKTTKSPGSASKSADTAHLNRLGKTGSRDDAAAAFLSRWESMGE